MAALPRLVRIALVAYPAAAVLAATIAWWRETPLVEGHALLGDGAPMHLTSVGMGLFAGLAGVLSTRALVRRTEWARALRTELRAVLPELDARSAWLLALASGTAEELLFRGALQPWLGLVLASLVFGAAHFVPRRRLWTWAAWATVVGLVLGGIFELTGSLAGAVLAHVLINGINLGDLGRHDPELDVQPPPPPRLAVKRTRSR